MIDLVDISKTHYRANGSPVTALNGITFRIERGEFVTIRGKSGSGNLLS